MALHVGTVAHRIETKKKLYFMIYFCVAPYHMYTEKYKTISTLIDTAETLWKKYREKTHLPCDHCGFTFDNAPFPIILHYDFTTGKCIPTGNHCSANCSLAVLCYSKKYGGFLKYQMMEWLRIVLMTVYNMKDFDQIQASPEQDRIYPRGTIKAMELRALHAILPKLEVTVNPFTDTLTTTSMMISEMSQPFLYQLQEDLEEKSRPIEKSIDPKSTQLLHSFLLKATCSTRESFENCFSTRGKKTKSHKTPTVPKRKWKEVKNDTVRVGPKFKKEG
jgi:hypothetical protein